MLTILSINFSGIKTLPKTNAKKRKYNKGK